MIKVTIDGPGGILTYESEIIRRALEAAGIPVTVTYGAIVHTMDDSLAAYNRENKKKLTFDEYFAEVTERMKKVNHKEVILQINNHPWGG